MRTRRTHTTSSSGRHPRWSARAIQRRQHEFLRSLSRKRPETRGTYDRALREFVRWCSRRRGIRFGVNDVEQYKRYLTTTRRFSPVSISTYLTAVRRFAGYLVSRGLLRENPADAVPGNARPRFHVRRPLTPDEADILLRVACGTDERGMRDAAMIRLMLTCGLSDVEVVRADVSDVKDVNLGPVLAVQGKGKKTKDEHVALDREVVEVLRTYLSSRVALPGQPLFVSAGNSSRGKRMTTRAVRDRINLYLELAGLRTADTRARITAFSLRHTAAAIMARGGATADEVRRRMRLGTLETARLYLQQTTPPLPSEVSTS